MSFRRFMISSRVYRCLASVILIFQMSLGSNVLRAAQAQTVISLPAPGTILNVSAPVQVPLLRGLTIHPDRPLQLDFIVDPGLEYPDNPDFKKQTERFIKYFLAALTVPEDQLWVNLSPYEKDRIMAEDFGQTLLGQDLLAEDYLLKQLSASLTHPDNESGKVFWDKLQGLLRQHYGYEDFPLNTFHKVWIVPDEATVYTEGNHAIVVESRLKVMVQKDYQAELALRGDDGRVFDPADEVSVLSDDVMRQTVLPALEEEVNTGETFAGLRQIYNALILATWYKRHFRETIMGQVYLDKNKIQGAHSQDRQAKEKIYHQYMQALRTGVVDIIKEEYNPADQNIVARKYFSGGFDAAMLIKKVKETRQPNVLSRFANSRSFLLFAVSLLGLSISAKVGLLDFTEDLRKSPSAGTPSEISAQAQVRTLSSETRNMIDLLLIDFFEKPTSARESWSELENIYENNLETRKYIFQQIEHYDFDMDSVEARSVFDHWAKLMGDYGIPDTLTADDLNPSFLEALGQAVAHPGLTGQTLAAAAVLLNRFNDSREVHVAVWEMIRLYVKKWGFDDSSVQFFRKTPNKPGNLELWSRGSQWLMIQKADHVQFESFHKVATLAEIYIRLEGSDRQAMLDYWKNNAEQITVAGLDQISRLVEHETDLGLRRALVEIMISELDRNDGQTTGVDLFPYLPDSIRVGLEKFASDSNTPNDQADFILHDVLPKLGAIHDSLVADGKEGVSFEYFSNIAVRWKNADPRIAQWALEQVRKELKRRGARDYEVSVLKTIVDTWSGRQEPFLIIAQPLVERLQKYLFFRVVPADDDFRRDVRVLSQIGIHVGSKLLVSTVKAALDYSDAGRAERAQVLSGLLSPYLSDQINRDLLKEITDASGDFFSPVLGSEAVETMRNLNRFLSDTRVLNGATDAVFEQQVLPVYINAFLAGDFHRDQGAGMEMKVLAYQGMNILAGRFGNQRSVQNAGLLIADLVDSEFLDKYRLKDLWEILDVNRLMKQPRRVAAFKQALNSVEPAIQVLALATLVGLKDMDVLPKASWDVWLDTDALKDRMFEVVRAALSNPDYPLSVGSRALAEFLNLMGRDGIISASEDLRQLYVDYISFRVTSAEYQMFEHGLEMVEDLAGALVRTEWFVRDYFPDILNPDIYLRRRNSEMTVVRLMVAASERRRLLFDLTEIIKRQRSISYARWIYFQALKQERLSDGQRDILFNSLMDLMNMDKGSLKEVKALIDIVLIEKSSQRQERLIWSLVERYTQAEVLESMKKKLEQLGDPVLVSAETILKLIEEPTAVHKAVGLWLLYHATDEVKREVVNGSLDEMIEAIASVFESDDEEHRWGAVLGLILVKEYLDKNHPLYEIMNLMRYRSVALQNQAFDIRQMIQVWQDDDFQNATLFLNDIGRKFSIARAILSAFATREVAFDPDKIGELAEFLTKLDNEIQNETIIDAESNVFLILGNDYYEFNGNYYPMFDRKKNGDFLKHFTAADNIQSFQEPNEDSSDGSVKQRISLAIKSTSGKNVLFFEAHGGKNHIWLTKGRLGGQDSDDLDLPNALSYVNMAEYLLALAENGVLDLDRIRIQGGNCFGSNFFDQMIRYLIQNKGDVRLKGRLLVVATGEYDGFAYGYGMDKVSKEVLSEIEKNPEAFKEGLRIEHLAGSVQSNMLVSEEALFGEYFKASPDITFLVFDLDSAAEISRILGIGVDEGGPSTLSLIREGAQAKDPRQTDGSVMLGTENKPSKAPSDQAKGKGKDLLLGPILIEVPSEESDKTFKSIAQKVPFWNAQNLYSPIVTYDAAMLSDPSQIQAPATKGGIDFNPVGMKLQEIGPGVSITADVDLAMLFSDDFGGFEPVIINTVPLTNLSVYLRQ